MPSAVLIQQASSAMRPMLELTASRHADYCAKHSVTYWPVIGDVQFSRPPHWNKIALVRHALAQGFETVVWLDADTVVVRDEVDVRTALNGGPPLGMVTHTLGGDFGRSPHPDAGVLIMRNTPRTREFFDAVWGTGPGHHPWVEQARILDLLKTFPDILQPLDDRWNSTFEVNEAPDPVIKAWHGMGARAITPIYDELKRLGAIDTHVQALASQFVNSDNVFERTANAIRAIPPCPATFAGRGIVICAGGIGYFPCAWVCIQQLRRIGCSLPIQVWHLGPGELDAKMRSLLESVGVECIDADVVRRRQPGRLLNCCEIKPFAILHCPFREVLSLDADNVPVLDPTFLFDTPEFQETGAIFWPDLHSMKRERAAWKFFAVPYRSEPEFESGQIAIDKVRCWRALNLAMWFNENSEFFYHHVHGDKDTFRFAWHRLGQAFAMPPFPVEKLEGTMCQRDFNGRRLFQHRNSDKWNFFRDNKKVKGFLFEDECQGDIRQLRKLWSGVIASP